MNMKLKRRVELSIEMANELENIINKLKNITQTIENSLNDFFLKSYNNNEEIIQLQVNKYNTNIQEINRLNLENVRLMNNWFNYYRDENEIRKIFFPIRFFKKRKNIDKEIKEKYEKISELTVENRFIKEKITVIKHQIEIEAINMIKQSEQYIVYEKLNNRKAAIISELKYILSTIPDIFPVELSLDEISCLTYKLNSLQTA